MYKPTNISHVLTALMKKAEISENALADATGVPQPTIHRILTGESQEPRISNLEKLARYFNLKANDLIEGHAHQIIGVVSKNGRDTKQNKPELVRITDDIQKTPDNHSGSNIAPGPKIQGKLPLLSWVQAGNWRTIVERCWREGDEDIPMIQVAKTGGPFSFCLRVEGDSMVSPEGKYSFPEGIIIQVDPDIPAKNKSFVVARMADTDEATFKQLIIDGGRKYLKPLNLRYPITECHDNIMIVAVVFGAVMDIPY